MGKEGGRGPNWPGSFYKIILPSTLLHTKLRIPEKFVAAHGCELSTVITLIIPDGRSWKVGLEKAEEMLWFSDGWQNLVDYYSIIPGDFLIFKYQGHSTFTVVIYDMTCTEIHYPSRTLASSAAPKHCPHWLASDEKEMDKHGSLDILGSHGMPVNSVGPSKIGIGTAGCGLTSHETQKSQSCCYRSSKRYRNEEERVTSTSKKERIAGESNLNENDASASQPFEMVAKPRAVVVPSRDIGLQSDPCEFVNLENNLRKTKFHEMMEADTQKETPRRIHKVQHGQMRQSLTTDGGELSVIKSEDEATKLGIRTCFIDFFMTTKLTTQEREWAIHAGRKFTSQNPSFMAIVRPMSLRPTHLMSVPINFCENHLHDPGKIELEVSDERRWPVYTIRRSAKSLFLSRGWAAFASENHLSLGDICVFERVQIEDTVLRVTIFRVNKHLLLTGGQPSLIVERN